MRTANLFSIWTKIVSCGWLFVLGHATVLRGESPDDPRAVAFFESQVRPLLVQRCYACHSAESEKLEGGLRLDHRDGARAGGDSGPAVVPGDLSQSLIVAAIRHEGLEMPPNEKLPDAEIAILEEWIRSGAVDPRREVTPLREKGLDYEKERSFWSFRPIVEPAMPNVRDETWSQSPVDRFILHQLDQLGLEPAPDASRSEWLRRVTYDLHGLPPTPEEMEAFIADTAADAYAKCVDRLLASPRYGERWGQHWLDVVRFAETEGFEYDRTVMGAWRFRDYVIRSINRGDAFDTFLREQIAGDELDDDNHELLIAAGFHRLGVVRRNAGNQEVAGSRNEVLTERADIIGSAILGLTIGCARCHDHKFDPITQRDYYQLQAYFAASHEREVPLVDEQLYADWSKRFNRTQKKIDHLKKALALQTGDEEKATQAMIESLEKELPEPLPVISTVHNDFDQQTPIHILKRGEWSMPGDAVTPEPLGILRPALADATSVSQSSPRLHLADWLTDPRNPLTPRVIVNRIWQYHFGRGLVSSPNDFGHNGQKPDHPELLDYLASRWLEWDWDWKRMHRFLLLSRAYRMSCDSPHAKKGQELDPQNAHLWHFARRRLTAEEIRDSMLVIAGKSNMEMGGPSTILPVDQSLIEELYKPSQWQVTTAPDQQAKRSVYLMAKRNLRLPFMEVFDQPTLQSSCARRESSTHAPQALELLNGQTSNALADAFAERLSAEFQGERSKMVDRAYLLVTGRPPTDTEAQLALRFLEENSVREFTLALFNLNAFLYVR